MIILGLTGSIGMGKTVAAIMLRRLGIPVHDADRTVHHLLAPGGKAVPAVAGLFPSAVKDGGIDRAALGRIVFTDRAALSRLEAVLHPMVRAAEHRFLANCRRRRAAIAVLDIPLLFETGGENRCDAVLVVSAPASLQAARVLARPGMTPDRFGTILAKQMPDREKRRRADYVVPTGLGRALTFRRLREIIRGKKNARNRP